MEFDNLFSLFEKKRVGCKGQINHGPFSFSTETDKVVCKTCGAELTPMAVIKIFAREDNARSFRYRELKRIEERIDAKNKTKCQHCQKMTRIEK